MRFGRSGNPKPKNGYFSARRRSDFSGFSKMPDTIRQIKNPWQKKSTRGVNGSGYIVN